MNKLPKIMGIQRWLYVAKNCSISILIVGIVFRIEHWPYSATLITLGSLPLVVIYILASFEIPNEKPDWSKVYPELIGLSSTHIQKDESTAENL